MPTFFASYTLFLAMLMVGAGNYYRRLTGFGTGLLTQ
ncbi:hypothetical protein BH10CHL1_BH10CHL1_50170 [soil metagenome]